MIHEGDTIDLIKKISIVGDELVIDWKDGNKSSLFSYWLRDHCQMPESRNKNNGQRLFSVKDLPSSISIDKAYMDDEGNVCVLFKPEDHCQSSRNIGCALIAMNSITTLMTGARNKKRSGKKIVLRMDYQLLTMIQCPRMTQN